jgi:hypothetical protein
MAPHPKPTAVAGYCHAITASTVAPVRSSCRTAQRSASTEKPSRRLRPRSADTLRAPVQTSAHLVLIADCLISGSGATAGPLRGEGPVELGRPARFILSRPRIAAGLGYSTPSTQGGPTMTDTGPAQPTLIATTDDPRPRPWTSQLQGPETATSVRFGAGGAVVVTDGPSRRPTRRFGCWEAPFVSRLPAGQERQPPHLDIKSSMTGFGVFLLVAGAICLGCAPSAHGAWWLSPEPDAKGCPCSNGSPPPPQS